MLCRICVSSTDPTQEACHRSWGLYSSHSAERAIDQTDRTDQESIYISALEDLDHELWKSDDLIEV